MTNMAQVAVADPKLDPDRGPMPDRRESGKPATPGVASLVERVLELERALAPFAALARIYRPTVSGAFPDAFAVIDFAPGARLTVGDLRRAAALLAGPTSTLVSERDLVQ